MNFCGNWTNHCWERASNVKLLIFCTLLYQQTWTRGPPTLPNPPLWRWGSCFTSAPQVVAREKCQQSHVRYGEDIKKRLIKNFGNGLWHLWGPETTPNLVPNFKFIPWTEVWSTYMAHPKNPDWVLNVNRRACPFFKVHVCPFVEVYGVPS